MSFYIHKSGQVIFFGDFLLNENCYSCMLIFFVMFAQNQSHESIVKLSFLKQNCIEISKFLEKFLYKIRIDSDCK